MLRKRIGRVGFGLAVLALPLSYGVKNLLGDSDATWIDPTMVFGAFLFTLVGYRLRKRQGWFLIVLAFFSAAVGWYMHRVEPGHGHSAWFVVMTDPVALTLNLVWFWVCTIYFVNEPEYATQWLSVSVICQLAIGIYLYFAMFGLLPASESVNSFLADYRNRQVLWFSGGGIPRMGGTFNESPLFGLFMLSGFAVLSLELRRRQPGSRGVGLIWTGVIAAAIGTICSFSDQVLIAASILVGALGWNRLRRSGWVRHLVLVSMLTLVGFNISRIYFKNTVEATNGIYVYGESFGQRKYNTQYGLKILAEQPLAVFWGVGPGRFGDYAAEDGMYREESTIQPGVTVIEWLVGYGLIGLVAIAGWLYAIGKQAWIGFGGLGLTVLFALLLGNMFQLRWLWESWFMALAYLYASGARPLFRLTADRARMKCL